MEIIRVFEKLVLKKESWKFKVVEKLKENIFIWLFINV